MSRCCTFLSENITNNFGKQRALLLLLLISSVLKSKTSAIPSMSAEVCANVQGRMRGCSHTYVVTCKEAQLQHMVGLCSIKSQVVNCMQCASVNKTYHQKHPKLHPWWHLPSPSLSWIPCGQLQSHLSDAHWCSQLLEMPQRRNHGCVIQQEVALQ